LPPFEADDNPFGKKLGLCEQFDPQDVLLFYEDLAKMTVYKSCCVCGGSKHSLNFKNHGRNAMQEGGRYPIEQGDFQILDPFTQTLLEPIHRST